MEAHGLEPDPVPISAHVLAEYASRWASLYSTEALLVGRIDAARGGIEGVNEAAHAAHLKRVRTIIETATEPGMDGLPEIPPLSLSVGVPTAQGTLVTATLPNSPRR